MLNYFYCSLTQFSLHSPWAIFKEIKKYLRWFQRDITKFPSPFASVTGLCLSIQAWIEVYHFSSVFSIFCIVNLSLLPFSKWNKEATSDRSLLSWSILIFAQRNLYILHRESSTNHWFCFLLSQSDFVLSIVWGIFVPGVLIRLAYLLFAQLSLLD